MDVSDRFLLEGAWYSFEQCGRLLRDAVILYETGSHPTSVGLAMLAREELGKARMLLDLWHAVADGQTVTVAEVKRKLEDHGEKQRRAQISDMWRASGDTGEARLLRAITGSDVAAREAARQELDKLSKNRRKRTAADRHKTRMRALYVDPNDAGTGWSRPADVRKDEALDHLQHAANDYGLQWVRLQDQPEILEHLDPKLSAALKAWPDRPGLPEPAHPKFLAD